MNDHTICAQDVQRICGLTGYAVQNLLNDPALSEKFMKARGPKGGNGRRFEHYKNGFIRGSMKTKDPDKAQVFARDMLNRLDKLEAKLDSVAGRVKDDIGEPYDPDEREIEEAADASLLSALRIKRGV